MSLEDIWSEPIVDIPVSLPEPTTEGIPRTSRRLLFLSDSDSEDADNDSGRVGLKRASPLRDSGVPPAPDKAQLDAMFSGLEDDDDPFDIGPALDVEKLKRQADAQLSATKGHIGALPSVSLGDKSTAPWGNEKDKKGDDIKAKSVMPKLDEERLLGHDGFPRLLKEYKNFKVTGKGREAADLERLLRLYHTWTHKMFPKFQFKDTVDRVEKLCRSRRMQINLKVWRDEAKGITTDVRHEVTLDGDDENSDPDGENRGLNHGQPALEASSPSSSRPSTPVTRLSSAASTAPSVPSSVTDDDHDMDVDALLREEEEIMREMNQEKGNNSYKPSIVDDDEDALWAAAGGVPDSIPGVKTLSEQVVSAPSVSGEADDDDMWNMLDEMDVQPPVAERAAESRKAVSRTSEPAALAVSSEGPVIGADWDDMYE